MVTFSPRALRRILGGTRRLEATPAGTGAGIPRALTMGHPGQPFFGFVLTSTLTGRSGTTPGTGTGNLEAIDPTTGLLVTIRSGITIKNRYTSTAASGTRGTCYAEGPYYVAAGWECP